MSYLLGGRIKQVIKRDNNADYTTTSTSFVAIDSTNLAITMSINGSVVWLSFTGVLTHAGNTTYGPMPSLDFEIDGTRFLSGGADGFGAINNGGNIVNRSIVTINAVVTGLATGSHTFKVLWKTLGNTATLYAGSGTAGVDSLPVFAAVEIG
jgi:hypothetical protein